MAAERPTGGESLLTVEDLVITTAEGRRVVDGISFHIDAGETVALVGESGSGKSLTAKAIAGLLPPELAATGSLRWRSTETVAAKESVLRRLRGSEISMLLQDPFTLLNPLAPIQRTMAETLPGSGAELRQQIAERIVEVGIEPARAMEKYPWELSGGMRQRIGLAAALSRFPFLLIADEPTTALDATTQRDVLKLIHDLQTDRHMAMLIITHDLRIATSMSERVLVMSQGRIVEASTPAALRSGGDDPYTKKLWAAELPADRRLKDLRVEARVDGRVEEDFSSRVATGEPILVVDDLRKQFPGRKRGDEGVWALRGVSFELRVGRSLGVIGESGSGKTTLARCLLGLEKPTSGEIDLRIGDPAVRSGHPLQCVFQDPYSSLNPAHSIGFTLSEAIRHRTGRSSPRSATPRATWDAEIAAMLESVGLPADLAERRPESLSGGQRQRVAIARALLMRPEVLVCDEPVAALDLTVQSQVLQVLRDAQAGGLTTIFITHDVSVARQMTDDLIVLYKGEIVEAGETAKVLGAPVHPYTQRLLSSVPTADKSWLVGATTALEADPLETVGD